MNAQRTADALLLGLQHAYLMHLMRPGSGRLPWLEAAMDRLRAGNG